MLTTTIEITGNDRALNQLGNLKKVFTDFSPETKLAGDYFLDFLINEVFNSEGSTYGARWSPLTPQYATQKAKRWGNAGILIASGAMKRSWKLETARDYFQVTNEAPYSIYHQDGTSKMPQRVLLKFDNNRMQKIVDIIVASLNKRVRGAM